jgi:hypothetical protein
LGEAEKRRPQRTTEAIPGGPHEDVADQFAVNSPENNDAALLDPIER